ncbi:MAG: hypothetical protein JWR22_1330 [Herminiimonas sp.]|nr:hypothetical protein [Herminiimonas sp.]
MADATMLASRQVRLAVLAALTGSVFEGVDIRSPGAWTTPGSKLPAILLRSPRTRKMSINMGQPEFTSTVTIELEGRVSGSTEEATQDSLDALVYCIEQALLTNHDLIAMTQQVSSIDTVMDVSAEGDIYLGGMKMSMDFELCEMFDPFVNVQLTPFTSMGVHVDSIGTFDATGTYPNPAFPASVTAAPRTSGPDGRDEGTLEFTLPQ